MLLGYEFNKLVVKVCLHTATLLWRPDGLCKRKVWLLNLHLERVCVIRQLSYRHQFRKFTLMCVGTPVFVPFVLPFQAIKHGTDLLGRLVEVQARRDQLVPLFGASHQLLPPFGHLLRNLLDALRIIVVGVYERICSIFNLQEKYSICI